MNKAPVGMCQEVASMQSWNMYWPLDHLYIFQVCPDSCQDRIGHEKVWKPDLVPDYLRISRKPALHICSVSPKIRRGCALANLWMVSFHPLFLSLTVWLSGGTFLALPVSLRTYLHLLCMFTFFPTSLVKSVHANGGTFSGGDAQSEEELTS